METTISRTADSHARPASVPARTHARSSLLLAATFAASLAAAAAAGAQTLPVGDPLADYLRVLEISGRGAVGSGFAQPTGPRASLSADSAANPWAERLTRIGAGPSGATAEADVDHGVRIRPTGAALRTFANTGHPFGWNDGALWQGRGLSAGVEAGVELRWRGLTARLHPEALWAQNASFDIMPAAWDGIPDFAYPWRRIDLPQRPGASSWSELRPGDSELRLDARGVTLGVSHRARWWGPGVRNAILLSNNAGGFPHAFVGTSRPVDIRFATLDVFYLHGELQQSDWFDESLRGNERYITGLLVGITPDWPRGLSLGAARVFYGPVPESGRGFGEFFLPFQDVRKKAQVSPDQPTGDDDTDQLLSLFMRWVLPESGFEVYTEWSRTDHAWDFRDFILEPEHSQGRTFGLRHSSDFGDDRLFVVGLEFTNLSKTSTFQVRVNPTWYEHWLVRQGYTHRGQLLGAGVGPGGNAQSITADLYEPWGSIGLVLERRVHDNDAYYAHAAATDVDFCCHDASFNAGPRLTYFRGDVELDGSATLTRRLNRYFQHSDDVWNLNLGLSARWRPR